MVYPISKLWFYPLCWILIKKIKGIGNIPGKKTFIIAANHETNRDHLLILYPIIKKLNKKVHFIATPVWWFNIISRQWAGVIPMYSPKQAYREAKKLIRSGEIVGIFPEGRLERKKRIEKPKTGAVRLALETGTLILPIGIKFSYAPFSSTINIGKLVYLNKNKDIKKQASDVMKYLYELRDNTI
ncbi:MAG: lysophospholipid acyltransferase family protein [Nanoarchaeota archaeon]